MLTSLPLELLSHIVENLVRDFLYEYFTSPNPSHTWNAISTLCNTSVTLRSVTHSLISSGLSIPSLKDGRSTTLLITCDGGGGAGWRRLSKDPLLALSLARADATARFESRRLDGNETAVLHIATHPHDPAHDPDGWWRTSALLELYNVIRETRLKSEWITQQGHHLRRLADLPKALVDPMERVKACRDKRLAMPALVEGAELIACTSFGALGQLSASARFFELVHAVLSEEPEWVCPWFDNIEKTLHSVKVLEKNCMIPLRWVQVDRPHFVQASHIYASRIVPALSNFLNTPVVTSDPICARWRTSVDELLGAWAPLDDEVHAEVTRRAGEGEGAEGMEVGAGAGPEFPQDVSP
ncbi:hypothetical protein K439DRAFT_1665352 [Ramaria rubella]|nr:hypothetical protein K439DRAFT_1665352 [Ramaria rubella]